MCARYPLLISWQLSHHLVSGESTLHQVALFEARSRIFLPIAQSCAALFCCLLAMLASSLGWLVGNNSFLLFCFLDCRGQNTCAPGTLFWLVDNCHTTWSQGNLHYIRLHFLKLDREFFCLLPSLARFYSAASSPSSRLRSDGSLAIIHFFCFIPHPSLP